MPDHTAYPTDPDDIARLQVRARFHRQFGGSAPKAAMAIALQRWGKGWEGYNWFIFPGKEPERLEDEKSA